LHENFMNRSITFRWASNLSELV